MKSILRFSSGASVLVGFLLAALVALPACRGGCCPKPCDAWAEETRLQDLTPRERSNRFSLRAKPHASPSPAAEARNLPGPQTDDRLIIGSWNIKWFGSMDPDQYEYVTMADFVEECDVVAVQELVYPNHEAVIQELVAELTARGRSYEYVISRATGYENNPDPNKGRYLERFAYLWDTERIERQGSARFMRQTPINNGTYRQVPYVASFRVTQGQNFDFRLATTHTVFKRELHWVRRDEIEDLVRWVNSSQNDGETDVIAIGDMNAHPPGQNHHFEGIVGAATGIRVPMNESRDAGETTIRTTVPTKSTSTNPTYFQMPVYDHAIVASPSVPLSANPMTRAANAIGVHEFDDDPWWAANGWTLNDLRKYVSDHRPIWIVLDYQAADGD